MGKPREDGLRNALRLFVGLIVSAACLWFATRGTDWDAVGRVLLGARLPWVVAGAAGGVAALAIRAHRWQLILRPVGVVPFWPSFSATAIGFAASAVLPFRLGEVLRPALLARRMGFGVSSALSSVVLERLFDMLFVVLCFLILSLIYPLPGDLRGAALLLGVAAVTGFVVLMVAQRHRASAERLIEHVLRWLPAGVAGSIRPLAAGFFDALGALESAHILGRVSLGSALLWGTNGLPFLFALLALGIAAPLVPAALASVVIVAAFVFMPQAPGFVGTWQAACVLALELFGVPKEQAVGYSVLTWLLQMLVNVGLGGLFMAREHLSLRQLMRDEAKEPVIGEEGI